MNLVGALHPPPGRHHAADAGLALAGAHRLLPAAGRAAAAGRFPDHLGLGAPCRAPAPRPMATSVATPLERHLGHDRRRHRDDLVELGRHRPASRCSSASTATSTAPRATSRRRSTRRGPICRPRCAAIPTYRKVNPADAPIMILALTSPTLTPGQLYDAAATVLQQKLSQVDGRRPGRRSAAARCRRCASSSIPTRAVQIRHRARGCPRRPRLRQRQQPEGRDRGRRPALPDLHQRPGQPWPTDTAPLVVAYRNGAAVRLTDVAEVDRFGRGSAQSGPRQRQAVGRWSSCTASPAPTSSTRSTGSRPLLPELQASISGRHRPAVAIDRTDDHPRLAARRRAHAGRSRVVLVILVVFVFLRDARARR